MALFCRVSRNFSTAVKFKVLRASMSQDAQLSSVDCWTTFDKPCEVCSIEPGTLQPCVVIVGAGLAGLSAGHRLLQCGLTNFKILEANSNPGGRIRSCQIGDVSVELGSEYLMGASIVNPVYTLAAQEGLLKYGVERHQFPPGIFFTSDGRAICQFLTRKARNIYLDIMADAKLAFGCSSSHSHDCVGSYFYEKAIKRVESVPQIERYDFARLLFGMFNALRVKTGEDLSKVNTKYFGNFFGLPGGEVRLKSGLSALIESLAKSLPESALMCSKPVQCIRWGTAVEGNPRAVVKCKDGQELPADYVIVTVPLGVLKNMSEKLFCPSLPSAKMKAINDLGFGHVNKVFVEYDTPFWAGSGGGIRFAWSPDELNERDKWYKGVASFESVPGSNKVIYATVAGQEAKTLEHCQDIEVLDDIKHLLRKFVGNDMLPLAKNVLRSSWSTDHCFYGAISYIGLGSSEQDICDIQTPLPEKCAKPPILLFAGEHTHPNMYGTMQGARRSGIREADRILSYTIEFGGPPNHVPANVCLRTDMSQNNK